MRSFVTIHICLLFVSCSIQVFAAGLSITSFTGNGDLSWDYPTNGVKEYRVEWATSLTNGLWCDLESGVRGIKPTSSNITTQVPMFYNVKALVAPPTNMVYIPAGWFQMGDSLNDGEAEEKPVRKVYVSAFYMDKYEVTVSKWNEVYSWAIVNGYNFTNTLVVDPASNPVDGGSWYDYVKWANALSEKEGLTPCYYTDSSQVTVYKTGDLDLTNDCVNWDADGYRLPTEAEWEKAARGGARGFRFSWPDNTISQGRANYSGWASIAYDLTIGTGPSYASVSPVGAFAPNGFGLYDMTGNRSEWCWDWADIYSPSDTEDPHGPSIKLNRILRGGSYFMNGNYCRVSYRDWDTPDWQSDFGFRLVKSAK